MQEIMLNVGVGLIAIVTILLCIFVGIASKNALFVISTACVCVIGGAAIWAVISTSPILSVGILVLIVCGLGYVIKSSGVLKMAGAFCLKYKRGIQIGSLVVAGLLIAIPLIIVISETVISVSGNAGFAKDFPVTISSGNYALAYKMANEMRLNSKNDSDSSRYSAVCSLVANASGGRIHEYGEYKPIVFENTTGLGLKLITDQTPSWGDWSAEKLSDLGDVAQYDFDESNLLAVRTDGSVSGIGMADSDSKEIYKWSDIKQICILPKDITAGVTGFWVAALTNEGVIVTHGYAPPKSVYDWRSVVQICRVKDKLIGLKDDGTVYKTASSIKIDHWNDIGELYVEKDIIFGRKRNGGVCVFDASGSTNLLSDDTVAEIEKWLNINQFFVRRLPGDSSVVFGLTNEGTIVSSSGKAPDWTGITAIAASTSSPSILVGLKENGEVVYWNF